MRETPIKTKSYAFAVRVVRLFQWLCKERNEFILSKQILRCGTSIGANVHEAGGSYSEKKFAAKIQIAFKEALETSFWLSLLYDTDYMETPAFDSMSADCEELFRILTAITKTLREKASAVHESPDLDPFSLCAPQLLTPNS
jgi:four helix bundle protein